MALPEHAVDSGDYSDSTLSSLSSRSSVVGLSGLRDAASTTRPKKELRNLAKLLQPTLGSTGRAGPASGGKKKKAVQVERMRDALRKVLEPVGRGKDKSKRKRGVQSDKGKERATSDSKRRRGSTGGSSSEVQASSTSTRRKAEAARATSSTTGEVARDKKRTSRVSSKSAKPARTLSCNFDEGSTRQTRSNGAFEAHELPWGWQNQGALLGKPQEVQAAARKKETPKQKIADMRRDSDGEDRKRKMAKTGAADEGVRKKVKTSSARAASTQTTVIAQETVLVGADECEMSRDMTAVRMDKPKQTKGGKGQGRAKRAVREVARAGKEHEAAPPTVVTSCAKPSAVARAGEEGSGTRKGKRKEPMQVEVPPPEPTTSAPIPPRPVAPVVRTASPRLTELTAPDLVDARPQPPSQAAPQVVDGKLRAQLEARVESREAVSDERKTESQKSTAQDRQAVVEADVPGPPIHEAPKTLASPFSSRLPPSSCPLPTIVDPSSPPPKRKATAFHAATSPDQIAGYSSAFDASRLPPLPAGTVPRSVAVQSTMLPATSTPLGKHALSQSTAGPLRSSTLPAPTASKGACQEPTSQVAGPIEAINKPTLVAKKRKPSKAKPLDPTLLSKEGWVEPEKDLRINEYGRPPVWCVGRQELCESLSYFNSYQGGHYDREERCRGYLLDGFPSVNDICEKQGRIIISHGGGNSIVDKTGYHLKSNQEREGTRMRALRNCLEHRTPVVLIAGSSYEFFPALRTLGKSKDSDDEVRYAVLGCYWVTDIWAEGEAVTASSTTATASDHFVRFKVRFEWVASQGTPWFDGIIGKSSSEGGSNPLSTSRSVSPLWTSSSALTPPSTLFDGNAKPQYSPVEGMDLSFVGCPVCAKKHRKIYETSISCYNETCSNFFRFADGRMPVSRHLALTYHDSMLELSSDLPLDSLIPQPVIPATLQSLADSPSIRDYSKTSWRGFGCSRCGRLSSRSAWLVLSCAGCGAETDARGAVLRPEDVEVAQKRSKSVDPRTGAVEISNSVKSSAVEYGEGQGGFTGFSYDLGDGAKVHHLWPRTKEGFETANKLFEAYQGDEAGRLFRRNPLTTHRVQGSLLCQQFTWNGGREYLHAIAAETYAFRNDNGNVDQKSTSDPASDSPTRYAAPCAKIACDYLQAVVPSFLPVGNQEDTAFNEILSVAYMTGGKMNFHDDGEIGLGPVVASISLGADAIMSFRPKVKKPRRKPRAPPAPAQVKPELHRESKKPRSVLQIRLQHGSIMVMEGANMQKAFEHAVEPEGVRFAATARYVGPNHARTPGFHLSLPSGERVATEVRKTIPHSSLHPRPDTRIDLAIPAVLAKSSLSTTAIPAHTASSSIPAPNAATGHRLDSYNAHRLPKNATEVVMGQNGSETYKVVPETYNGTWRTEIVFTSVPQGYNKTFTESNEPYYGASQIINPVTKNGTNETLASPFMPAGGLIRKNPTYTAESNFDFQSLNLALNQELIELDLFHNGLARFSTQDFIDAGLTADDRFIIEHMADQEVGHALAITHMLGGDRAAKQYVYQYPFDSPKTFILFCQLLTRFGEAGVYGFLQQLDSRPAAQILLQSITIEALETGLPQSYAWTLLSPYIKSCPSTNPRIEWQNFPALKILNQPDSLGGTPGISSNYTLTSGGNSGREVHFSWEDPGKVTGYDGLYKTCSFAGEPKYAAFIGQLTVSFAELYIVSNNTGYAKVPDSVVFPRQPQVVNTVFVSLTDQAVPVRPCNLSMILHATRAGPTWYFAS
ncbi:hypothetical protein JCM10212_005372 [Sporobolomyces blumeae]